MVHPSDFQNPENPVSRFTGKTVYYHQARPSYPTALLSLLVETGSFSEQDIIADIGSGTGLLAELFLQNGNFVYGIEPNEEMRLAGEQYLQQYPNFKSISASAENTMLTTQSCDWVTAGQAFHWFNPQLAKLEFQRILKPTGNVVLVWNSFADTELCSAYIRLLQRHNADYLGDGYKRTASEILTDFFDPNGFTNHTLPNHQTLDCTGFIARMCSSSYAPTESHPSYTSFLKALQTLFQQYQKNDQISLPYETQICLGSLS